jgi:hypothetical protein
LAHLLGILFKKIININTRNKNLIERIVLKTEVNGTFISPQCLHREMILAAKIGEQLYITPIKGKTFGTLWGYPIWKSWKRSALFWKN